MSSMNTAPTSMPPLVNIDSPPHSINRGQSAVDDVTRRGSHDYEMSYPDYMAKKPRKRPYQHSTRSSRGVSPSQFTSTPGKVKVISPSDMSTDTDVVRIETGDFLASYSTTNVVTALETCKDKIVFPFNILLKFIGWKPIGYSAMDSPRLCVKLLNWIYLSAVLGFIIFSYVYEAVACQWKLDFNIKMVTTIPATPTNYTFTPAGTPYTMITTSPTPIQNMSTPTTVRPSKKLSMPVCEHVISTYIIPNILHFIAYIIGFYHFRLSACENIYALMEKVFQYCSTLVTQMAFQLHLIKKLRLYLFLGFTWVLLSLVTNIVYCFAFAVNATDSLALSLKTNYPSLAFSFFAMDLVGAFYGSMVSMVMVYNYGVHSELITFYADAICDKLQMRSIRLKVACSDMLNIRNAIRDINGTVGVMTTFLMLVLLEMLILGSCALGSSLLKHENHLIITYRVVFILYLIPILFFPVIQAARVNNHCSRFKRFALEMRTFGYLNATNDELDSFVLFTTSNRLLASVLHVPINGAYLLVLTVAALFLVLILFQLGIFGIHLI